MSVFRNLNTVRKLMFAFGTVGAIIAGLGYFGINTVSTVNDIVAILYERELKGLSAIKDVNLAITGISRLTRAAIISTDQKEKEQFNKTIGQLKEQFQNKLSEFQKLTITDEAKTIAVELERIFPPYMELMEEAVRLTLRDDNVNAIKKVHDAIPDAQQVMSKASELAVMKEKQAEKVYRESNVLYERSRNIMAGLTVVGVGLGLMLGWVISQMIGRSLAHLGKVVSKLESGDLTARAAVESTDEVGQLAQSFNKMGEQLEHIVKNQEQEIASKVAEVKGITDAIGKSQAAIEFNLDGTIITANQNFLSCLGYTLDEIKGRHHRMFADPAYAASAEYQAFWAKLNRGEFDVGVYPSVGKTGKEIWIQASYNPILNSNGKVYKVVKFATDITSQKTAQVEMERLVAESQTVLSQLAANDLTQEMTETYSGELEKIKNNINAVVQHLTQTITTVREAVEGVKDGSEEITRGNEDLSHRTSEQASALEETSASMEEMTSTVKQNAENAKQANQLAIAARETADKGGTVTKKAVDAMGEINKSSKKIADIITVIDEIAFQTNLLALNAAVEAARAGEHGRGFAVVAAEVRNLAQRSATAAKEIKGLINESIQRVMDGSELVNQSGKTLEDIVSSVKRVTDIIAEISAASQEQASGIDQVNKAIMSMDETTQQNAALVEQTTSASQSMKEQAKELMRQVGVFKIRQSESRRVAEPAKGESAPAGTQPTRLVANAYNLKVTKRLPIAHRSIEQHQPVGLTAGNGKDYRNKRGEFEEF